MIWQYVFAGISFLMFFGFVGICFSRFGLQSCYSAYGMLWEPASPSHINWWQAVTVTSAFILAPAIIETASGSTWQFAAFLGPVSLLFVGATPDYAIDTIKHIIHSTGAILAAMFIIIYTITIPHMLWVIGATIAMAVVLTLWKKNWMLWGELALYLSAYIVVFLII